MKTFMGKNLNRARMFTITVMYIDDSLTFDNAKFKQFDVIYPPELQL